MTSSEDGARTGREDAIHADWSVAREDIQRWYATHPETSPGFDVAPIILNERRQAAVDKVRATWPDLAEGLIAHALPELKGGAKSMADELGDLIALHHPLPRGDDAVAHARPGAPRLRESDVRRALQMAIARLNEAGDDDPTRERIALEMSIDERTLRRRLARFPSLRDLLRNG